MYPTDIKETAVASYQENLKILFDNEEKTVI